MHASAAIEWRALFANVRPSLVDPNHRTRRCHFARAPRPHEAPYQHELNRGRRRRLRLRHPCLACSPIGRRLAHIIARCSPTKGCGRITWPAGRSDDAHAFQADRDRAVPKQAPDTRRPGSAVASSQRRSLPGLLTECCGRRGFHVVGGDEVFHVRLSLDASQPFLERFVPPFDGTPMKEPTISKSRFERYLESFSVAIAASFNEAPTLDRWPFLQRS